MTSMMINPQAYFAACILIYVGAGFVGNTVFGRFGAVVGMVGGTLATGWMENHGHMFKLVSALAKLIA